MTEEVVRNLTGVECDPLFALSAWGWREINELYGHLQQKPPSWAKYFKDQEIHDTTEERLLALLRQQAAMKVDAAIESMGPTQKKVLRVEYVTHRFDSLDRRARECELPFNEYRIVRSQIENLVETYL